MELSLSPENWSLKKDHTGWFKYDFIYYHSKIEYTIPFLLYIYFFVWIFFLLIFLFSYTILLFFVVLRVWWLVGWFWFGNWLEMGDYSIHWMMTFYHLVVMTSTLLRCPAWKAWGKAVKHLLRSSDLLGRKKLFCIHQIFCIHKVFF